MKGVIYLAKTPLKFFEELTKIPRESGNEKAVSDYVKNFAEKHQFRVIQDEENNVIIFKNGQDGLENAPPVMLQSHLDMVCQKDDDIDFDFLHDGIKTQISGDWLHAVGTTLGADDGVGVAVTLALLDDDKTPHPPIEAVFTTNEETGLEGAHALNTSALSAKRVINLDSEEEGIFCSGCAGGTRVKLLMNLQKESVNFAHAYRLVISGLKSGHSGIDIDKNRSNAIKIISEILVAIPDIRIAEIVSEGRDNVIPKESEAVFFSSNEIIEETILKNVKTYFEEDKPQISLTKIIPDSKIALTKDCQQRLLFLLNSLKSGVIKMSQTVDGLTETSVNVGVLEDLGDCVKVQMLARSGLINGTANIIQEIKELAYKSNAEFYIENQYPAWEFRLDSPLRELFVNIYEEMYNKKPIISVIHAGLECGVISQKMPDADIISVGSQMEFVHTTKERMSISSLERFYDFLKKTLSCMR
jgi:dipeptidase D